MIAKLYQAFLYPIAFVLLQALRPFLSRKTQEMAQDKNNSFFKINNFTKEEISRRRPFWIHAASGEIEYARPVIRELKKRFPDTPLIVTHSSPSAKKILQNLTEVDAWGSLPWDLEDRCLQFLDDWRPRCVLIARTDVWPVMAQCCRQRKIPSLLFAATFAENSSRLKGLSGKITEWALNALNGIHCVSAEDLNQLQRLHIRTPVAVHGDTRFDQVFHRLLHPKLLKEGLRPSGELPVFVAGSTWPEDERVLIPALSSFKNRCKIILVPHEIHKTHLDALAELLKQNNLSFCFYRDSSEWKSEDVLIVDEVGILAELYTWGTLAFVGGSFRKQIHSVMEPLAAGLPVLVGPYHANNREALHFKNKKIAGLPVVQEVKTTADFAAQLQGLIDHTPTDFSQKLKQELEQHRSSSLQVVEWCKKNSI